MKIIEFHLRIIEINKNHRSAFQNHLNHENPELHASITKIMKLQKFQTRITKIMKIIEFNVRITKIMKILELQWRITKIVKIC